MKKVSEGWASILLIVCCMFWGLSFPLMPLVKAGFNALETNAGESAVGATVNAWRFLAAGLLLLIPMVMIQRRITKFEIHGGCIMGLTFGCGMFLQILGLSWMTPSASGMITAMSVLLAPIAQAFFLRRPVANKIWLASTIAMTGCLILTFGPAANETAGSLMVSAPFPYLGEIVTLGSTICFTAHMILIDYYGSKTGVTQLTTIMFIVVGIGSLFAAFGFGALPLHTSVSITTLFHNRIWLWAMLSLILLSSVVAMWLMNRAQPSLSPARAAVLYTIEPVFALLFSLILGQERLSLKTIVGGALIVGAAIFTSVDWPSSRSKLLR